VKWIVVVIMQLGLAFMSQVSAQSLWERRVPSMVDLVGDTAARHVGDLVTIIVRENTDVENRDQRQMAKAADASLNLDFSATGDLGSGAGAFDFQKDSERAFRGQSQYRVEQEFLDQITVPIIDILPNGNLVIGGRRERLIAGEKRTLVISGVVRAIDISPSNTVRSQHVAHFKVCYEGDGPESSYSNQGFVGRLFNRVWPF
jgi:flagellar L-ring protein precursor FlgH